MLPWQKRPFEIANLVNPAYCSLIIYTSLSDFYKEKHQGMSYALSFLILPMVLHKPTLESFPQTTKTSLYEWVKCQSIDFGMMFRERTRQLIPYTKESLMFGMQHRILKIDKDGNLIKLTGNIEMEKLPCSVNNILGQSAFLGRWFAQSEHEAIIFRIFGIRL